VGQQEGYFACKVYASYPSRFYLEAGRGKKKNPVSPVKLPLKW